MMFQPYIQKQQGLRIKAFSYRNHNAVMHCVQERKGSVLVQLHQISSSGFNLPTGDKWSGKAGPHARRGCRNGPGKASCARRLWALCHRAPWMPGSATSLEPDKKSRLRSDCFYPTKKGKTKIQQKPKRDLLSRKFSNNFTHYNYSF